MYLQVPNNHQPHLLPVEMPMHKERSHEDGEETCMHWRLDKENFNKNTTIYNTHQRRKISGSANFASTRAFSDRHLML